MRVPPPNLVVPSSGFVLVGGRPSLALVLPHEPDAVFQGEILGIDISGLAFENKTVWLGGLCIFKHFGEDLIFSLKDNALRITDTNSHACVFVIANFFKHDELLGSGLDYFPDLIDLLFHPLDLVVDLVEL